MLHWLSYNKRQRGSVYQVSYDLGEFDSRRKRIMYQVLLIIAQWKTTKWRVEQYPDLIQNELDEEGGRFQGNAWNHTIECKQDIDNQLYNTHFWLQCIEFQDIKTTASENEKQSNDSIYDVKPSIFKKSNGFEAKQ
jgi:hypothetical protein